MATLQKFKLLATQCAVVGSPARSPTTSPVVHIRRRKTLRMLLGKSCSSSTAFHRRYLQNSHRSSDNKSPESHLRKENIHINKSSNNSSSGGSKSGLGVRSKLKDLFVSSPPEDGGDEAVERLLKDGDVRSGGGVGHGEVAVARRVGHGGVRPLSATLRQRLLMRRAWRPVLVAIPEVSP